MLHFHIPHTVQCQKAFLAISTKENSKKYCGKLVPFSTSFQESQVNIIYHELFAYYYGYYFVIYYEAVNVTYTIQEFYWISQQDLIDNTIVYPGFHRGSLNQQFIFVAHDLKFVRLFIVSSIFIQVHDGPGKLSPKLEAYNDNNSSSVNFTGSLGFIVIAVPHLSTGVWKDGYFKNESFVIKYDEHNLLPLAKNNSHCTLVSTGGQLKLSGHSTLFTISCLWELDTKTMFNINEFTYSGWDTLLYSGWTDKSTNTRTHCQYGALSIWFTTDKEISPWQNLHHLCNGITNKMSIPLVSLPTLPTEGVYLHFSAYPGYSSGSFAIDYVSSPCNMSVLYGCQRPLVYDCCTECLGQPCQPYPETWRRSTHVPSCVDIWTVQSQYFPIRHVSKCTYNDILEGALEDLLNEGSQNESIHTSEDKHGCCEWDEKHFCYTPTAHDNNFQSSKEQAEMCYNHHNFTDLRMANIIGPYEVLMDNWVVHSLPAFAEPNITLVDIELDITLMPDFPVNLLSYSEIHYDLKPFKRNKLFNMSHLFNITYIMNKLVDIHIFHLRLQQNLICSAFEMNHTLHSSIQHMFLEAVSHYTGNSYNPFYDGIDEPMDFCHVKFTSTMNSSLQVDHSNFPNPQRSIQIIAKLIPEEQCVHCLLQISLWENLNLAHQIRYTTWSNMSKLQWFCIHPYAFRLQVNITRPRKCSDNCYLLLKFNHFQQQHKNLFIHKFHKYYTVEENSVYSTWAEANYSCSQSGHSLPELSRDISQMWVNMAYTLMKQTSVNAFFDMLFIGMYKDTEVIFYYTSSVTSTQIT